MNARDELDMISLVQLAAEFNNAMENNDSLKARACMDVAEDNATLHLLLVAVDYVRDYIDEMELNRQP